MVAARTPTPLRGGDGRRPDHGHGGAPRRLRPMLPGEGHLRGRHGAGTLGRRRRRDRLGRAVDHRTALRRRQAQAPLPATSQRPADQPTGGTGMIGDAIVFDGVAHVFNFQKKNAFGPAGEMFNNHLYAFHAALTPEGQTVLPPEEFLRQWTLDEIDEMVYRQSDTDMLVAMPLPLTDLFRDGLSPWEECAELARRNPDRTVFWGSVNPL